MPNALVSTFVLMLVAADAWKPPENPDPSQILKEAHGDTQAQRFEQALDKHVWYHHHALQIQPAQQGVRLSYALAYWKQLLDTYPPALVKLKEIRDEAEANAIGGKDAWQAFADLASINRTLGEEARTKDVFMKLHNEQPQVAKRVYSSAQPALVITKEYKLCDSYLDPEATRRISRIFAANKKMAKESKDPNFVDLRLDYTYRRFTNQAATLVALLVVNGRREEASSVAFDLREEWDDAPFRRAIDDALDGKVPDPWP